MGRVVNKSFNQIRKSIGTKTNKILTFIEQHSNKLWLPGYEKPDWTAEQNSIYEKLSGLCYSLVEELDNLDEVEPPEYSKK